jgi:hypothetical protein
VAANDEFPRGVDLTSGQTNAGLHQTVTFPAEAGISWVVTNMEMILFENIVSPGVNVVLGGPGFYAGYCSLPNGSASITEVSAEWEGAYTCPVGTAATIGDTLAQNPGAGFLFVTATAYPI